MEKMYQDTIRVKQAHLQALRRDFKTLQMKKGEIFTSYCTRTMVISNKMGSHGEKINDVTIIENILHALSPKYD